MPVALIAVVVLLVAVAARAWAALRLMSRYRVDDYLATPDSRRLYIVAASAPVVAVLAMLVLAFCTRLWWVETAVGAFALLVTIKTIVTLRMRSSGAYAEFYRRSQWR